MLHLTDLMLAPDLSRGAGAEGFLPRPALELLTRVAPTSLPLLCTACFGAAFRRVGDHVHRASGRDELVYVDLRRNAGTLPAGLPDGERAAHTTLALDGIEHLDGAMQDVLAALLARAPFRVLSATDLALETLRPRWRADLLAHLSTITLTVPALARRGSAIAEVARQRLTQLGRELGCAVPALTPDAEAALAAHPWPGDVAELDAVLARTLLASSAPMIDGVQLRWQPDDAASPADAPTIPIRRRDAASEDDTAVGAPALDQHPAAHAGFERSPDDAPSSDEALIATLPAPGLFRKRRDDGTPAPLPSRSGPPAAHTTVPTNGGTPPMPTLEALAVELAHQLKNPLVTIKTFVGSIESLRDDPHELGQFRALTDEAVTRMDEILDGLLAFARLHAPALEPLDVLALLRDALRAAWRALSSKQVELDAPDGAVLHARADREHLRFALATLTRHVAETIEPRGRLTVGVQEPSMLRLEYRESGAITHLRGAAQDGASGLPLALLLVRGALARVGGDVEIALESNVVSIRLHLSPP
ncbi:hypothetical protein K2Z84_05820 [Candidatus Binatia bacterium]|jgi:hypothetical protein|nr:hypothetical protein [Candidatus Binatia bacterium]